MDEVIAQGMLFLPTGYDITAATITFILYNLALHPEIQEKLNEEIVNAAGNYKVWKIPIFINTSQVGFK